MGWVQCGLSCRSYVLTSCIPSKAQRKIQSIWECDPPSPSPSLSAPHHTHKNEIFLAMLICCLSLQTGLHKKGLFFSPQGCRGVKLHTDGKAIYTPRSSQCSLGGRGFGRSQTSRHIKGKPDKCQEGEVTSHRGRFTAKNNTQALPLPLPFWRFGVIKYYSCENVCKQKIST